MIRMAHRIAVSGIRCYAEDPQVQAICHDIGSGIQKEVRTCEVIVADNISEYVNQIGKPESVTMGGKPAEVIALRLEDFPNIAPPFEKMFIEYLPIGDAAELLQNGVFLQTFDAQEAVKAGHVSQERLDRNVNPKWFTIAFSLYFRRNEPLCVYDGNVVSWFTNEKGELAAEEVSIIEGADYYEVSMAIPWMAISFMHCRNVVRREAGKECEPDKPWARKHDAPQIKYHVLNINPMKEVLRTEGGSEKNGLPKALHICRGHFKTYTDESRRFGRDVGTFWCPSHVRGKASNGVVLKDYAIKSPAMEVSNNG